MAEDDSWLQFFPTAYSTLTGDEDCEDFQQLCKDFEDTTTWIQEIPEEVMATFAVKKKKFNQLPKTPCEKARKRTRCKVASSQGGVENVYQNLVPTKLEFNTDSCQSEAPPPNRPVRNTRKKRSSNALDEKLPVRTTRQSRKPLAKKNGDAVIPEELSISNQTKAASVKEGFEDACNFDPKKTAPPRVPLTNSNANKNSPSVMERANAYETMLMTKQTHSPSPLRTKKVLTPNAASPNFTHATISSQAKASPQLSCRNSNTAAAIVSSHAMASPRVESIRSSTARQSKSRASRTSSQRISLRESMRRASAACQKKKTAPSKPQRSRLRLNKQKAVTAMEEEEREDGEITESQESDVEMKSPADEEIPEFVETQADDCTNAEIAVSDPSALNQSEVVITEVFELFNDGKGAELKELEIVHTKTTPVPKNTAAPLVGVHRCSSDQGFDEGDHCGNSDSSESRTDLNGTFTKVQEPEPQGRSTRTRTKKALVESCVNSTDSVPVETQKARVSKASPEQCERSTRTRTRAVKAKDDGENEVVEEDAARTTRTRQRKMENQASKTTDDFVRDVCVVKSVVPENLNMPSEEVAPFRSTRSKMRKVDQCVVDGKNEEVIAGSPAIKSPAAIRLKKKRLNEEHGLSPKKKRSCVEQPSHLESEPMSTSSPVQAGHNESQDYVNTSLMSPLCQSTRPYLFKSAQKKPNGFMNRTPGFANNTKVLSIFGSAPTNRNNMAMTSFLKRNTPTPKSTLKEHQEQKKQWLLEKQSKDKERLERAAETKRLKLEHQIRLRNERYRKAAECREMEEKKKAEITEKIQRKFKDKAVLREKMAEEKMKAETEKQKMRMIKQKQADARRRQEEDDRKRKRVEQEEDARRQEDLMQRKRNFEESERKRQIAEEKKRQEERIAELEQKKNEELVRLKKMEEERDRERERAKLERDRQIAQERAERERIEREKRDERDRRLKEEMEKLKAMEKMRLKKQEDDARQIQASQAKLNEMHKLISQHNQQIKATGSLNSTQTLPKVSNLNVSTTNSYSITPAVKKMHKPSENPNDYGLNDKESDESTDDESDPKKKIPEWASWSRLEMALIKQDANPPDVDAIFQTRHLVPLDLLDVFPKSRMRHNFNKRTSSAVWASPPMKSRTKY